MTEAPDDLSIRWTPDGLICDARPYGRSIKVSGLKWVGLAMPLVFVVSPPLAVVVFGIWFSWMLWAWYAEQRRVDQTQELKLTSAQLSVRRVRNATEVFSTGVPLQKVGRVCTRHTKTGLALVVQLAGDQDLEIPIQQESQRGGEWLAGAIEQAAKAARKAQGDVAGRVPESLRELLGKAM